MVTIDVQENVECGNYGNNYAWFSEDLIESIYCSYAISRSNAERIVKTSRKLVGNVSGDDTDFMKILDTSEEIIQLIQKLNSK